MMQEENIVNGIGNKSISKEKSHEKNIFIGI